MKLKKILCTLFAVLIAMLPLLPAAAQRSAERTTLIENAEIYTLSPNLGDGIVGTSDALTILRLAMHVNR